MCPWPFRFKFNSHFLSPRRRQPVKLHQPKMPSANTPAKYPSREWGVGIKKVRNEQKGTIFQIKQAKERCNHFPGDNKFPTLPEALQNLAALKHKLYLLEYLGWAVTTLIFTFAYIQDSSLYLGPPPYI